MSILATITDVLTLGAGRELNTVREAYDVAYKEYSSVRAEYNDAHAFWTRHMRELGNVTSKAVAEIDNAYNIILFPEKRRARNYSMNTNFASSVARHDGLQHVAKLLKSYSTNQSVAGGVGAGSAVAIGSWSLVSVAGTASTGTAIGSLTGAAATHATLAWFGGGALAAGGAGMAGGVAMLGGIALLPVMAFATWHTRSKIKEVGNETDSVKADTIRTSEATVVLRQQGEAADAQTKMLEKPYAELVEHHRAARDLVFATPAVSKGLKMTKRLFRLTVYDPTEADAVRKLEAAANQLAAYFKV